MYFIDLKATCSYLGIDRIFANCTDISVKKVSSSKSTKRSHSDTISTKRKVRFLNPPYTNYEKSVTTYSIMELFDVFERFVHMETLDRKKHRHKTSLHKAFHFLFSCYEDWIMSYLLAYDKRRKKPFVSVT
ncbi:hypothetical protein NPIL_177181 [Nephila pilipes]|uniref:Uncharacterized protein n=1 Tax=Nephila pilipes TaxID=299642 RepID=A0A8X6MSF7_NEPPI|nr:hypothetical protein NPIL_177181 [Nephila pilipes]